MHFATTLLKYSSSPINLKKEKMHDIVKNVCAGFNKLQYLLGREKKNRRMKNRVEMKAI